MTIAVQSVNKLKPIELYTLKLFLKTKKTGIVVQA
jgi:hypothetical protein